MHLENRNNEALNDCKITSYLATLLIANTNYTCCILSKAYMRQIRQTYFEIMKRDSVGFAYERRTPITVTSSRCGSLALCVLNSCKSFFSCSIALQP